MICLSRPYPFKIFKGCLPEILLGRHLNTLSEVLCKIGRLKNFITFTEKHLCWDVFVIKMEAEPLNLLKGRVQHRCFHMNFGKFLRTTFITEHLRVTACVLQTPNSLN